jgi:hypothetical protein
VKISQCSDGSMGVPSFSAAVACSMARFCVCFAEIQFSKLAVGSARIEFPKRKHMLQWTEPAFLRPR